MKTDHYSLIQLQMTLGGKQRRREGPSDDWQTEYFHIYELEEREREKERERWKQKNGQMVI